MDTSGVGITDETLRDIGFVVNERMSDSRIKVWVRWVGLADSYRVAGFNYRSVSKLFVYNNNGFFTALIHRDHESDLHPERSDFCQICVIKDLDHLRDIIRVLSADWRTAKEGN